MWLRVLQINGEGDLGGASELAGLLGYMAEGFKFYRLEELGRRRL